MLKPCRDPYSDGTTAAASGFKTVFVATSLDTHLALTLSLSDTVADFKRKILLNHEQCFPEIGALTIHSLKVEYQGKLYHLHESDMVVSGAFEGSERRLSLFVDASSSLKDVKEQNSLDPYDKGKFEGPRGLQASDAIAWKSPGEISRHTGLEVRHVDGTSREGFSSMVRQDLVVNDLRSKDDSKYHTEKVHYHTSYETRNGDGLNAKKKRKVKKSLDVAGETAGVEDSFVGAGSKVSRDVQIGVIDADMETVALEKSDMENVALEKSDMENVAKEKYVMDRRENLISSNVPSEQLHEEHLAVDTTIKKKKRKKQHKETNSYIPDNHDATSKSETMLQGSVLHEACGGQVIGTGNYGKEDDKSMLAPTTSQKDYMEEDVRLTSNSDVLLSKSVKPSDIVKATPAKKELVVCLGILNNSSEAVDSGDSKSKIRKAKKSTLHKQDQLNIEHDLSAPNGLSAVLEAVSVEAHIEEELNRDENVLSRIDPDKSEENSELTKNHVPVAIYSRQHHKHLDSNEKNWNEKEPASDVALTVMENLEGAKSGYSRKKRKKSASHNDYCLVERTKDTNDTLVFKVVSDVLADRSIFSCIKGKEASQMFSPTYSHKNDNTASDSDNVHLSLTEVDHIYSKNDNLDLNSGKQSNINQSQDRAKEAECLPVDQPDGELENTSTTKKKKKAKRTGNSTGEGLEIPEVNRPTMDDQEVASLDRATIHDQVNMEQVKEAECLPMDQPDGELENKGTTKMKKKAKRTGNSTGEESLDINMEQAKEAECLPVDQPDGEPENKGTTKKKKKAKRTGNSTGEGLDINMEQAKEAECLPMDQPDAEPENKGTTKKKKKAKRTGEGLDIPEVNQQTMDDKEAASLLVKLGNVDTLKVSGSDEKTTIDRSGASELGLGKNAGLKCTGEPEQLLQNVDVPEVPSHQIGSNCEVGHATEVEPSNAFVSEGENGSVNFRRYFVPGEDHTEAASTDKVEGESNVVEGLEKADEHTFVPEGKQRPSKAWEYQKNSLGINSDDNKHEYSSSKTRQRKNVSKKEISTSSKKRSIAPISGDVKVQTLKKSVEPILMNGSVSTVTVPRHLEENDGSLTSSTFNTISGDSERALLNKSSHKKQTGVIFGDGGSESSGDENGILKSGSTTLSLSSPGDSRREGSNNSARDHEGRKTDLSSKKPNPGSMSIDKVLRSSIRFKKAKFNASQSEAADSESQQELLPEGGPRRSGRISLLKSVRQQGDP